MTVTLDESLPYCPNFILITSLTTLSPKNHILRCGVLGLPQMNFEGTYFSHDTYSVCIIVSSILETREATALTSHPFMGNTSKRPGPWGPAVPSSLTPTHGNYPHHDCKPLCLARAGAKLMKSKNGLRSHMFS